MIWLGFNLRPDQPFEGVSEAQWQDIARQLGWEYKQDTFAERNWQRVIYVAGKYRGATEWEQACNISHAGYVARELWRRGWCVICPHKNTAYFGGILENPELDFRIWLTGDLELLRRSDAVYMLKGWEESQGAKREYARAMELGKPIYFESKGDLIVGTP